MSASGEVPYVYVWRYEVPSESRVEFERVYGAAGDWVELFRRGSGYLATRLLADVGGEGRYLTIDEWDSREAFEHFRSEYHDAFDALDERCTHLTSREEQIGHFRALDEAP
ncbi:MAG TPA: antibiotic biosynthesis monooxygenase family protein [Longimicrobiales bacterium]|nr:antibiotic biosynthesis monooxygenase family protein [Longimicrobiales bacterium]